MRVASFVVLLAAVGCGSEATTGFGPASVAASGSGGVGGEGGDVTIGVGGSPATGAGGSGGEGGAAIVCPEGALVPGVHQRTIAFGGKERVYEVQVPLSYDNSAPVPLVLDIHGYTSNKDQQELVSGMSDQAEENGFVVARPQGFSNSWNAGDFCCGQAQSQKLDDVGLMKAIVAEVRTLACIDGKRIYSTGISNGGALSHRLACEAADVFAAVAPVSFPIDFDPFDKCKPSRPIAVMHSHGTSDVIVPYNGGFTAAPTPESFAYWGTVNGCQGDPVKTYEKGKSRCETYQSCAGGVQVALCTVNGGHVLYTNVDQVPIAELSWQFLSKYTLP